MFELQMQYLVLQKAGVFRAKSIEAFAWSLQDRQTLSGPHHSGALAEQASIRCKAELLWDFAQDHSLNFWRSSQSLWGLSHSGEGGKFMQSKFKWVLPLNLQSSSKCSCSLKRQNKHVTCPVTAADVACSAQPLLQCSQLERGVSQTSQTVFSFPARAACRKHLESERLLQVFPFSP